MRTTLIVVATTLLVLLAYLIYRYFLSSLPLPKPSGPQPIGVRHIELRYHPAHDGKGEIDDASFSSVDPSLRRVSLHLFYPASQQSVGPTLPIQDPRVAKAFSKLYRIPYSGRVRYSHSIIDAEMAGDGPFPVVIFSHGGFSYDNQNLSNVETLASHGYVVITVSHTDEALLTVFPNADEIAGNTKYIREANQVPSAQIDDFIDSLARLTGPISNESKLKEMR